VIELVDSAGTVLESSLTDANGDYSFTVSRDASVRVRVKSHLERTTGPSEINLAVVDNINGNALYALQGDLAAATESTATRNLNAASGWDGSSYSSTRAAAPFALLDTLYNTTQAFVSVDPEIDFPTLDIYWSPQNRSADGDVTQGEIGTSSYTRINTVPTILILGDADSDTDEYDQSVITHEFGHYFEDVFSRSDSIGGSHSLTNRLDLRVAFGEGWGNALTAFIDNPIYRDSFGNSQNSDFGFDVEENSYSSAGWFNEGSAQSILYDIMDSASDGVDTISAGLGPVYRTFISNDYKTIVESTSIYSFTDLLRAETAIDGAAIDALLTQQTIVGRGRAGVGETNDGGIASALPVYKTLTIGGPAVEVCSVDDAGEYNKLGNRASLLMDVATTGPVTVRVSAVDTAGTSDPDFRVFRRGVFTANAISADNNVETNTRTYEADSYVLTVFDDENTTTDGDGVDKCFNVTAQ